MQEAFDEPWLNLGVDAFIKPPVLPARYWPGIGLRPGGERPDLEPLIPVWYAALYQSVAAHSRRTRSRSACFEPSPVSCRSCRPISSACHVPST